MPIFQVKARSWETYLAGFGASGALLASAFVMFAILVGVVTFNAWPHPGNLFGRGGEVAVKNSPTSSPAQQATTLNLTKLLGGRAAPSARRASDRGKAPRGNGVLTGSLGGSTGAPGGSPGRQLPVESPQPPSGPQPRNAVSQVVSGAGNTVQRTTDTLGNALGGSSSPGLGGLVGGVGRTLNDTLQSLAGKR
ncbi:MAG: hypothetical protein QOD14_1135 [Solirubrobacterales bacterium]|nr:hypothetical protein [Solirubrobacterales bacterium]